MSDSQVLSELLGLPQVRVTAYELRAHDEVRVTIESTGEAAICPQCQQVSFLLHETGKALLVRDLALWQRRCWLHYAPRRFKCTSCHDTFVERVAWRTPDLNYTTRYEQALYERARREPLSQIAATERLSDDQVHGIFERGAKKHSMRAAIPSSKC